MLPVSTPRILLTGATGYIGGRLLKVLERQARPLRCLARRPQFLQARVAPTTEVVSGNVLDRASLDQALHGGLVTPVYARIGRQLIDSIRHPTVVQDPTAHTAFALRPMGVQQAIARALRNEDREWAETRWSDALSATGSRPSWGGVPFGTRLVDSRVAHVHTPPALAFRPIRTIGGATGWYYANWLWQLRGFIDLLVRGVGLRRGRRDPAWLIPGDTVDFWRVEAFEPDRRLRLVAEMKLPGRAWLEFEVEGNATTSQIRQTAIFDPLGLWGRLYWYALYPLHSLIFAGMLRRIARASAGSVVPDAAPPVRGAA